MKTKYKGILCILCSAFCFALMNTFVRLSGDLPSIQKSFFRNVVALIFAYIVIKKNKESLRCKQGNFKYLMIRSFFGTIGVLCNFYAVDHLVLSDASMLNKMSPFFVIILSMIFLNEKVNLVQGLAVVAAFVGSLFIIKPTFANMELVPSLIGLLGGFGAGAAYTAVRYLGQRGEKGSLIVFVFSAFSCLVTLPFLIFQYAPMELWQIGVLLLAGLAAAGGQFAITAAYSYAPAKEISVYDYSQVIFSAILGFILFGQIPDRFSILGYFIVCATAIGMFFYGKKQKSV
ncbi:MAG TPA: EamA family transporter [Lachnoclostridium phytofermentans]|uniref:EamA family transporter n=1 Tax=Lachnoclostridium phytofermentans TaxID=66219 RepID=A0A3D2X178_9FIRM|nr:DMT family transporter [Lachnoclostridium sp.]HCL00909.1 EamA family transporter [Lachnoclostridium phytofermentans]